MTRRIVFDTAVVISASVFGGRRLSWLQAHWRQRQCLPLVSHATASELARVLHYKKLSLTASEREEALAAYLPYCEIVEVALSCQTSCRDPNDQPFLDLAHAGNADILVSGDRDLLTLAGQTRFAVETPEAYRVRLQAMK